MFHELLSRVVEAGLKFETIFLPKDMFARLSARDMIFMLNHYQLRQLDDLEKAQVWLKLIQ